ncbi:MAG TPA: XRE family transcriptional regulator, partial [Polyangiaceae bacterium]|nr:XRE family transcriptional regulator [Polyangiaceae bacterium]
SRPSAGPGDEVGAAALGRRVAESLRELRKEKRLSLDQLAAASGVSRAALSQIEGSRTNPTLSLLWKVAVGLGVPFQALLGGEQTGKPQVLRAGDSPPLRSTDGRMESRLLSPAGASQGVDVYELRLLPKCVHRSEAHGEGTTETLVVLTGALRMTVGDDSYDLVPGDSIFFRADLPHVYESRSSHDSRCINVISYGRS